MLVVKEASKGSTVHHILLLQHHGPIFHIVNYNHQNPLGVSVIKLSVFVDSPGEIIEDSDAAWSIVEGTHEHLICSPTPSPQFCCAVPINSGFVFF